jgi:hypothetical protein
VTGRHLVGMAEDAAVVVAVAVALTVAVVVAVAVVGSLECGLGIEQM